MEVVRTQVGQISLGVSGLPEEHIERMEDGRLPRAILPDQAHVVPQRNCLILERAEVLDSYRLDLHTVAPRKANLGNHAAAASNPAETLSLIHISEPTRL